MKSVARRRSSLRGGKGKAQVFCAVSEVPVAWGLQGGSWLRGWTQGGRQQAD